MTRLEKNFHLAAWLFLLAGAAQAQVIEPGAGLVTPLSALGASARADALGDALVGLADDPSALFYNPAGLSQLKAAQLSLNHNSYLAGTFEETVLVGLPIGPLGGFAGALQYVSWGGLDERDPNGVPLGTFTDGDWAFSLGWGMPLGGRLSVGAALHANQQKIVDSLYTGLSADFGFLWSPGPGFRLGAAYTGLGTGFSGFTPAQDLHWGMSALSRPAEDIQLRSLLSGDWEPNGVSRLQCGLEGSFRENYFLRLGYQQVLADNQIGGLTGFTAGAGIRLGQVKVDYAFIPYGDLGISHRVSLNYEFPNPTPIAPVTVQTPVTVQAPPVTLMARPVATPVPASADSKNKVEVLFDLPENSAPVSTDSRPSNLLAAYEKAAQQNPGDSRAWRNLGIVYLRSGKEALGLQCLEQALRLNPQDATLKQWISDYLASHPNQP